MITVNNKEYRNLVEQVGYLTNRVDEHYERDRVLADYGIRVVGSVDSVDNLPNPATYDGLYGDAYTVGTGAPYDFYIFTRPLQGETENRWLDLGQLAIQGPQGEIGPEGPVGPQGESTQWYVGQGVPYLEANTNSLYFDTTTANIYQKQEGQWVMVANIKGNTGAQGPQGPQGPQGEQGPQGIQGENGVPGDAVNIVGILTSSSMLPDPDTVARDSAYVIEDGTGQWLYFITGLGTEASPLIWDKVAFENGTTVLVNGNPVQTFDADSKVPAVNTTYRVYGTTTEGAQTTYPLDGGYGANTIAIRGQSGRLMCGSTLFDNDCANKKYVDEQVQAAKDASVQKITTAKRLYGTSSDGTTTTGYILNGESAEAGSIPQRRSGGRIVTGTPTVDADATTKKYVDDKYNGIAAQVYNSKFLIGYTTYSVLDLLVINQPCIIELTPTFNKTTQIGVAGIGVSSDTKYYVRIVLYHTGTGYPIGIGYKADGTAVLFNSGVQTIYIHSDIPSVAVQYNAATMDINQA